MGAQPWRRSALCVGSCFEVYFSDAHELLKNEKINMIYCSYLLSKIVKYSTGKSNTYYALLRAT